MPTLPDKPPFIVFGDFTFAEFVKFSNESYKVMGAEKKDVLIKPLQSMIAKYPITKQLINYDRIMKITVNATDWVLGSEDVGRRGYFVTTSPYGNPTRLSNLNIKLIDQIVYMENELMLAKREIKQLRAELFESREARIKTTRKITDEINLLKGTFGSYVPVDKDKENKSEDFPYSGGGN